MSDSMNLRHDQMSISPYNVRENVEDMNEVEALAASILENDLIHAVTVHPWQGRKNHYGVHAGGRRWRAIGLLISRGQWAADRPIRHEITDKSPAQLLEISYAENALRRALRPYEDFLAVKRMQNAGLKPKEIAQHLGQTLIWVQRNLRLGSLAPAIFEAFKNDAISLEQAKAYAATEDHVLQLRVWEQLKERPYYQHEPRHIHALMGVGDRDAEKLLRFVGDKIYADAGGRYTHDLFADIAQHRGRVEDEGVLLRLVDEKLETLRGIARKRAGRDVRFAKEPPRNDFNHADKSLQVFPQEGKLDDFDEEKLRELRAELDAIVDEAEPLVDLATNQPREGCEAAIAALEARDAALTAQIAEIENRRAIILPEGEVIATLTIRDNGEHELLWWWENRKAQAAADKPARKAATAAKPAAPAKAAASRDLRDGSALADSWNYRAQADAIAREDTGLTADGVQTLRSIRRMDLRGILIDEARLSTSNAPLGRDFLIWAQARMLLTSAAPAQCGMQRITGIDADPSSAKALLQGQPAQAAFDAAVEQVSRLPSMLAPDLALAFLSYRVEPEKTKDLVAAVVACIALERSLAAPGYRMPVHDAVAHETSFATDTATRQRYLKPAPRFFALFHKAHNLDIAEQLVADREQLLGMSKMKTAELHDSMVKLTGAASSWLHPMLAFTPPAIAAEEPAAAQHEQAEAAE